MVPETAPANRNLKIVLVVVASLAVVALIAVGVIAGRHSGSGKAVKGAGKARPTADSATVISTTDLSSLAQDRLSCEGSGLC
ncbi:hypothetical protein [Streptomyces caatingaensis]|nr:hypothetical protein [Streptomyces caatingaensis]